MFTKACNSFGVRLSLILILSIGLLGLQRAQPVLAATLSVANTNDSGAGSLRQAVVDAISGDTITFNPLLAGQTITLASDLIITKNLTIDGSGLSPHITISGGDVAHLLIQNSTLSPTVTISDLTISDGYTSGSGGAINAGFGNLTLINTTLRNNHALGSGGAVAAITLMMKNTTLYQNQAGISGGAVAIEGNGFGTISNSTITQNLAGYSGGAIYMNGTAEGLVFNSTFAWNNAADGIEIMLTGNTLLTLHNTIFVCSFGNNNCYTQISNSVINNNNSLLGIGTLADFGLKQLAENGGPTRTMALFPESPLIDAGDDTICANAPVNSLDQRGVTRPHGAHCDIGAFETQDVTRPAVVSFDPENEALNVPVAKMITITFSEEIDPTTVNDSSIFLTPFNSNTHIPAVISSTGKVVILTPNDPLEVGTTFLVQITGAVEDLGGNALDQVWLSSFTTGPNGVRDTTATDFAAGTLGACYLSNIENGEVTLTPLIGEEFSGAGLPANWSQLPLNGGTTVTNDAISADGAMAYYSNATFTADHRLKFVGTFSAGQSQRVGLVGNTDFSGQWAAFSTNNTTDKLYAVTSDGQNTLLPGDFIGTKHTYEIIWLANAVHFYVDNSPIAFAMHNVTLTNLRPMLSDSSLDGQSVTVEWMHFTPYSSPCTFVSRAFDAGKIVDWLNLASWTGGSQGIACIAALPPGPPLCTPNYGFTIETRTGNTSTPNGTWSAWQAVGSSIASPNGRYLQYRATLSSDTPGATLQLFSVVATYLSPPPAIYRVATNGVADPSCGASWSNPCDLQYALTTLVGPDDEVWVRAGVYKPGNDRTSSFVLRDGIAIYGGFAGTETTRAQRNPATNLTVLSGDIGATGNNSDNSYHVLVGNNTNNSAILDGFTVTGGNADDNLAFSSKGQGGGMYNFVGGPIVNNVIFTDNSAKFGGGMYNGGEFGFPETASYPILTNVTFKNNSAFEGGGMFNENYVHATLTGVIFDGNTATRAGGGMEDRLGTLSLTDVVFKNNTAGLAAGGMQNFGIDATLTNVTFSDNSATMYGGGLVNADADANLDPKLINVTFARNSAAFGGGMWNHHSSPSLTDVVFSANTATDSGGGIYNEDGSNLTLTNVTIENNSAGSGSGIFNSSSSPNLLNVTFSGNTGSAGSRGGAMVNDLNSSPNLTNVTFANNSVVFTGGAMLNSYNSNPSLVNVTFVGNSSNDKGGAIYNWESHPTLKHATFHGNSSSAGGAIYNDESSHPSIINSILYRDSGGEIYNNSGTAAVTYSIVQGGYPGAGNLDVDPRLGLLQENGGFTLTMALRPGSRAINAADDTNCPATDQRGVARPQGSHCDIGAYEYKKKSGNDTTGVFRPSNGLLYLKNSNDTGFADMALNYGLSGDYPVVGDWNGDDTVTIGIYRDGYFYLRNSNTIGFAEIVFAFGQPGDQPIAGDWNGDGVDTIGVFRPSNGQFFLRNSNTEGAAEMSFYLGNVGDVGIAGDWDGDGLDTTGVFRPSNGLLYLKNSNETGFADVALNYGLPGDKPVTGDWDNDGIDTIGVYRNGTFYLRNSNTIGFAEIVFALGIPGDMPIAGNWDNLP
jgi:predicted outer membrane repeat protein